MIHTIVAKTVAELDASVNAFMTTRRQNLPVRTEVFVVPGEAAGSNFVYHKATIFYDDRFPLPPDYSTGAQVQTPVQQPPQVPYNPAVVNQAIAETKKQEDRGALWVQKNGSVTGKFRDENIAVPLAIIETVKSQGSAEINLKGVTLRVIANKFKKTAKHPDYVLLPVNN